MYIHDYTATLVELLPRFVLPVLAIAEPDSHLLAQYQPATIGMAATEEKAKHQPSIIDQSGKVYPLYVGTPAV